MRKAGQGCGKWIEDPAGGGVSGIDPGRKESACSLCISGDGAGSLRGGIEDEKLGRSQREALLLPDQGLEHLLRLLPRT